MSPFLLEFIWPFFKKTAKYWIVVVIALAIGFYVRHEYETFVNRIATENYQRGYNEAEARYKAIVSQQTLQYQAAQLKLQQAYDAKMAQAINDTNKAIQKADFEERRAESILAVQQSQNATLQHQLDEALHHVPLATQDSQHPFTAGFVGLFNLATKNSPVPSTYSDGQSASNLTPEDILQAGFFKPGSTPLGLAQPASSLTQEDVLNVVKQNMAIANQCIDQRQQLKLYINELCDQGYCH